MYNKPGVEVTQVQQSFNPTLNAPDLPAVILGNGYYSYVDTFTGQDLTTSGSVTLSVPTSSQTVDSSSIVIEIGRGSEKYIGNLSPSCTGATLTFSTPSGTWLSGTAISAKTQCTVTVWYRAYDTTPNYGLHTYDSTESNGLKILSPVHLAASIAQANGTAEIYFCPVNSGTLGEDAHYTDAQELLATAEVYAICPLSTSSTIIDACVSNAISLSDPTEKKERVVIGSLAFSSTGTTSTAKDTDAATVRDNAIARSKERYTNVFPDVFYAELPVHVNMLASSYITNVKLPLVTGAPIILPYATGTYQAGTVITSTVLSDLASQGITMITASLPLLGSFAAADVAGMVSNLPPQQGFTNSQLVGFTATLHGKDWFKESQLNTIASGGNFVITTPAAGVLTVRHQLTTDMSSVEHRELSILKTRDYVAKYLRGLLSPMIGKYNITSQLLAALNASLGVLGTSLVREGVIKSFKTLKVTQQGDTLFVDIQIEVFYPCNYIKINLIF